jgi:hypothetical protein
MVVHNLMQVKVYQTKTKKLQLLVVLLAQNM